MKETKFIRNIIIKEEEGLDLCLTNRKNSVLVNGYV